MSRCCFPNTTIANNPNTNNVSNKTITIPNTLNSLNINTTSLDKSITVTLPPHVPFSNVQLWQKKTNVNLYENSPLINKILNNINNNKLFGNFANYI